MAATDSLPVHKNNRLEASMHLRSLRQKKLQLHVVYAQSVTFCSLYSGASELSLMMLNALVWLAAHKCTALVLDPESSPWTSAQTGRVHREVGFASPIHKLVDDLRYDIDALEQLGRFGPAGSGPRAGGDTGMRSALFADPIDRPRDVGCFDAFAALWERLGMVREELMEGLERDLIENVEVHYVRYPEGGYFQRHVDDYEANDGAPSRRSVSFICYLNDPGAPAWTERDGGALRVHSDGAYYAILPDAGSLVLFDSMAVEHEVRPTRRERTCLIGRFHAPTLNGLGFRPAQ